MGTAGRLTSLLNPSQPLKLVRTYYFRKIKKGCECPEPKEKVIKEKSCKPCCFETWKPKSKNCLEKQLQDFKKPKPPRQCYPGMVKKPPPDCNQDDTNPFRKKSCAKPKPPPPPKEPPPPPKPEKPLPASDWDNC